MGKASDIHLVRQYAEPPETVWRLLVDPALIPLWTSTGKGGRPRGFLPIVGTRFQYVAKPVPGWNGIVECEVLDVREPFLLRYTWRGGEKDDLTLVTNRLEPHEGGTRFTWDHTGFVGIGGYLVSRVLYRVRRRMLDEGFPAALSRILAAALFLGAANSRADTPSVTAAAAVLSVRVVDLRSDKGQIGCGLWASEKGFPKDHTVAVQTKWCPIANKESLCNFGPIPANTYAVACFHDEDKNGILDTGLFGIPTEGIVASNQAKGFMGPPSFKDAKFWFPGWPTELRLKMGY